jgi:phospholipase/carboxylesterase
VGLVSRREFAGVASGVIAGLALHTSCAAEGVATQSRDGRLTARPVGATKTSIDGVRPLGLDLSRDAYLRVPAGAGDQPLPLIVLFHGAGGSGERFIRRVAPVIEQTRAAVLVPTSRNGTWDAIRDGFGPDVSFLDRTLEQVFRLVAIDPRHIAAGGFSDGATYALSLGLINGDLFQRIVAFSPGFVVEGRPGGRPQIFISHGTDDQILPIDRCSRRIVPNLKQRGYEVIFREFQGGHEMPTELAKDALAWATG